MTHESTPSQERRDPFSAQVRGLRIQLLEKYGAVEALKLSLEFSRRLREKYPDFMHRRAYHAFNGTRPAAGTQLIEGDFPEGDSVLEFLRSALSRELPKAA